MRRIVAIGIAVVAGGVVGVAGLRVIAANAEQAGPAGFHAIAVSATQSGEMTYAWFVGQDGGAQFCKITVQGPHCAAVGFDNKR